MEKLKIKDQIDFYKGCIKKLEKELEKQPTTIEIQAHKFEVYHEDASLKLNYLDTVGYCERMGKGWRLPTRKEQLEMYENKKELGLKDANYWSSTEYTTTNAYYFNFISGNASNVNLNSTLSVRAVRTIK
jgi:hypothetical protein